MTRNAYSKVVASLLLVCGLACSCSSVYEPMPPDYTNPIMWHIEMNDTNGTGADVFYVVSTWEFDWVNDNGDTVHYADVWNEKHRSDMNIEMTRVADYMACGNNFYAPYYRHITLNTWGTRNEDIIKRNLKLSMSDVKDAFDEFIRKRDNTRPLIIAGFSQGGTAVVELLKHMDDATYDHLVAAYVLGYKVTAEDTLCCSHIRAAKGEKDTGVTICYNSVKDVKYIQKEVSEGNVMCINPVNWTTDSVPATIHDTITVTTSPHHKLLVVANYAATEYKPILGFINVGDIHGCEPWLYSECLKRNFAVRTRQWRTQHQ